MEATLLYAADQMENSSAAKTPPALPYTRDVPFNPLEILAKVYHACGNLFPQGIHDAYLYGSYARGDFDAESDIDILLTVDGEALEPYEWPLAEIESELSLEYDRMICVNIVPLRRFIQYADDLPYYRNVRKEGIRYES